MAANSSVLCVDKQVVRDTERKDASTSAYSVESGPCGDIYIPTGAGRNTPKILAIHGGGWRAQDRASFRGVAEALAKRGAIVYNIDYRLSTEAPWPACGDDCLAAAAYLSAWRTNEFTDVIFTIGLTPISKSACGTSSPNVSARTRSNASAPCG